MTSDKEIKPSSDLRDDVPNSGKNYRKIQDRSFEYWTKIIVTAIALVIVVLSFYYLLHFGLASKFRPHTIYDLPIIIALSALPMTILVLLIRYFYKNNNNNDKNIIDSVTTTQVEFAKCIVSACNDVFNPK